MNEVRLAGGAGLALVMLQGELVRLLDQSKIVVGTVVANFTQQIAKLGNGENVGRICWRKVAMTDYTRKH